MKELIEQAQKMGIPGDVLEGYLSSGNNGLKAMRLRNWIKKVMTSPEALRQKRSSKVAAIVAGLSVQKKEDTSSCVGGVSLGRVYKGFMTKGEDRREISIQSTGTGYYMLEVSRKNYSKLCPCCFGGLYDGIKFRKEEIFDKLEGYRQSGFDVQIQFK